MKSITFFKLTGSSLTALGLALAPMAYVPVQAQDSSPTQEQEAVETEDTAGENFEDAEAALEEAGRETVQGIEAAGEAAEQQIDQTAQEASQAAQEAGQAVQEAGQEAVQEAEEAAQRAEVAAENAVDSVQQRSNWGWLGLLGLAGLFGLVGGNKRRVETDARYHRDRPATATDEYHAQR